jgi:pyruvate,water dikinase
MRQAKLLPQEETMLLNHDVEICGKAYSLLSPSATNTAIFGAKTANLAKAAQLGFAVPEGLAVSKVCTGDLFASIAQEILGKLIPPVAVRSSATKEDSETKAFAGMFETHLGIRTSAELANAFSAVKNSGKTSVIENYYGEVIPPEQIAVLVQRMIDATRAGVAFSKDPSTGESKVIVESNYGLGKSVVDGDVTPDSIECLNDGSSKIFIGRKSIQITLADDGIRKQDTPTADSQCCSLTDEEIKAIAALTRKVECDLGFAADIEWAFDAAGTLWLLQARPITTL